MPVSSAPPERLALLARAIAGRRLTLATGDHGPPTTDGVRLWVPPDAAVRPVDAVVVQAGLIAAGSLQPRIVARLVGRRSAAARYLALEARRLAVMLDDLLPPATSVALLALEDIELPSTAQESLERALAKEPVEVDPWLVGTLKPSLVLRARGDAAAADAGSDGFSSRRLDRLRDFTGQELDEDDEDGPDGEATKRLTTPLAGNPASRLLRDLMDSTVAACSSPDEDGAMKLLPVAGARAVKEHSGGGRIATHGGLATLQDDQLAAGTTYPEWDAPKGRYKPAHCTVHHMDPTPREAAETLRLGADHELQRALARLGLALARHGRQADGEGLDLRALVDFGVARAAREQVDARVYETRRHTARDLGVLVLLDASGSTGEAKAAGHRIWDEQRRLAGGLVHALETVGDRVAAYGFRSYGRHDVRCLRIKHFDDRFDRSAERRLIDLQPGGYTRLGAALRHGTALAQEAAGTSRQLLLLVSDGLPYEEDYQRGYAEADSRRALEEAVRAGVGCVCVSLGSMQDAAALERVWGAVNHLHVPDARDVAPQIEFLVRAALKASLDASHGLATPRRAAA